MTPITGAKRIDGIDLLRGFSILAVLFHHINLRFSLNHLPFQDALPKRLASILFWNGANGVCVFFAISGFLITSLTLRRWKTLGAVDVRDFYRLRFARIAPLLVALLGVLSALHLLGMKGFVIPTETTSLGRALLAALTFHVNRLESVRGYLPGNWDVLWSLSVEEVFYLGFPLVCRLTKGKAMMVGPLLAFIVMGPLARTVMTTNELWADYGYLSSMDAIALGCLGAMATNTWPGTARSRWIALTVGASALALVLLAKPWVRWLGLYTTGLDMTTLAVGTCLVMMAVSQGHHAARRGTWPLRWVRWFGRHSYEVYLTHMFVVMWGVQLYLVVNPERTWAPVWYVTMVALSGVLGGAVARWYSEPLNRRLRRNMGPIAAIETDATLAAEVNPSVAAH